MGTDIEFGVEGAGFSTEQEKYSNASVCVMAFDGRGKTTFDYESVVCYEGVKRQDKGDVKAISQTCVGWFVKKQ